MGPSQPQLFASHDFRRQQHLSAAATASGSEAADLALSERSSLPAAGVASSSRTSNTYQGQDAAAAAVMMRKETQEEAVKDFMMSEKVRSNTYIYIYTEE